MRSLIVGATSGVGRELARCLARRQHDLVLAARGAVDLAAESAHLRLSFGVEVQWIQLDATDPIAVSAQIAEACGDPIPSNLLFPVGLAEAGDDCFLPAENTVNLIHANLTTVMTAVAALLPKLIESSGGGNVVGFGSVGAVRGRGANVVYSAAKRGLEAYFESLRHRTASSRVRVQFYRLGYIATQMSYGRDLPFPVAAPDWIAERVADGLGRDLGLVHLPRFWAGVLPVVRATPWWLYKRSRF